MPRDRLDGQTPTGQNVKNEYDYNPSTTTNNNGPTRQNTAPSPHNANTQIMHSPIRSDYATSPPFSSLDASNIDPSILPTTYSTLPSTSRARAQAPAPSQPQYANGYSPDMYNPNTFAAAPGLDFLQGNGWDHGLDMNWAQGGDMGVAGLGWEGVDHDFSEGNGGLPDLFEGFFFGGAGNI
jgi:hypothetical protein